MIFALICFLAFAVATFAQDNDCKTYTTCSTCSDIQTGCKWCQKGGCQSGFSLCGAADAPDPFCCADHADSASCTDSSCSWCSGGKVCAPLLHCPRDQPTNPPSTSTSSAVSPATSSARPQGCAGYSLSECDGAGCRWDSISSTCKAVTAPVPSGITAAEPPAGCAGRKLDQCLSGAGCRWIGFKSTCEATVACEAYKTAIDCGSGCIWCVSANTGCRDGFSCVSDTLDTAKSTKMIIIGASVGGGVLVICLIVAIVICNSKKRERNDLPAAVISVATQQGIPPIVGYTQQGVPPSSLQQGVPPSILQQGVPPNGFQPEQSPVPPIYTIS